MFSEPVSPFYINENQRSCHPICFTFWKWHGKYLMNSEIQ
jgi:hypothetical protein